MFDIDILVIGCLAAFLTLCFAIVSNPEGTAEVLHNIIYGVHRAFTRIYNQIEFRIKQVLLWGAGKIDRRKFKDYENVPVGNVKSIREDAMGLLIDAEIFDTPRGREIMKKMKGHDIAGGFSLRYPDMEHTLPDMFIENEDGTRLAVDLKEKVNAGIISVNTVRAKMGLPIAKPNLRRSSEGLRQERWSNCLKHQFSILETRPILLNEKPTKVMELVYRCRNCGLRWLVPNYFFNQHDGVKGLHPGREAMKNVPDHFITICKFGEVCPVHNRSHGDWKCLPNVRKE